MESATMGPTPLGDLPVMPALLNWLLRLLPSNPICLRIVKGGSTRTRQQWIRAGFLGTLILVMLLMLLANFSTAATSLRSLATTGSMIFAFLYWGFGFLRMGTTGFVAQAHGRDDGIEIRAVLARALLVGLAAALMLIVAQHPLRAGALAIVEGDFNPACDLGTCSSL